MSLLTALYSGASGLDTNATELSVVGDNIANANTIGFKGSRAAFADAMAQTLIGSSPTRTGQRGLGAKIQLVQKILRQGALINTGVATDLGIEGRGFFAVSGTRNGQTGTFFTRAGQFTIDDGGYLVSLVGMRVQGYTADNTGSINSASVGDLQIGNASSEPRSSTSVTLRANLDANDAVPALAWSATNASNTSNFASATTLFDSLGNAHQVDIYFRKTGAAAWEWHALTDGGNLTGGTAGTPTEIATGTMTFDTQGRLATAATAGAPVFNPLNAVNPQPLAFNFGDPTGGGGTGLAGITQFASPHATSFISQDGYDSGQLVRVNVDTDGSIIGIFNNGQTRTVGQVAIADFQAPDMLAREGDNLLSETRASGERTIGGAGTGRRGIVSAGTLEQSNVDMASEFIRMIAAQRGFQANSKTLTTADQLLAELMTIKR